MCGGSTKRSKYGIPCSLERLLWEYPRETVQNRGQSNKEAVRGLRLV